MIIPMEAPAHVQHEGHETNGSIVVGGTNWDLSRTAIPTPVVVIVEEDENATSLAPVTAYQATDQIPPAAPTAILNFAANSAVLNKASNRKISAIPKGSTVIVAAHADSGEKEAEALAEKRLSAVVSQLKKQGLKVAVKRSFGDLLPLEDDPGKTDKNRRVEIFVQ